MTTTTAVGSGSVDNNNNDNDDDDLIELRFEDIPVDMDELISDIIMSSELFEDDEDDDVEKDNAAGVDGVDEYGQATTTNNKTNPKKSRGSSGSGGMTVSTDKDGRPSILSMRPSLISPTMADKLLEGLMNISSSSLLTKLKSTRKSSSSPRYSSHTGTGDESSKWLMRSSVNLGDYDYDDITDEDIGRRGQEEGQGQGGRMQAPRYSISSDPSEQQQQQQQQPNHDYSNYNNGSNNNGSRRYSISANPDVFGGGGGIPIDINDEYESYNRSSSMGMQQLQKDPSLRSIFGYHASNAGNDTSTPPKIKSRRFSVSRVTVSMFDRPFDDYDHNDDTKSSFSSMNHNTGQVKPVEVLSNECKQMYGKETYNVQHVQEEALAKEMELLSFTHRSKINFDVHGIIPMTSSGNGGNINGNMDMNVGGMGGMGGSTSNGNGNGLVDDDVDKYLKQLDDQLKNAVHINENDNGKGNEKVMAFMEAQKMNPNYVNSKEFRLMFLRMYSDCGCSDTDPTAQNSNNRTTYDVSKAKDKLLLHFQIKKQIFGNKNNDVLGRDVRLSDLDSNDRIAMNSGAFQIMPERDTAGRAIILYAPGQRIYNQIENWMKAMWYLMYVVAKDIDNQLLGVCIVVYFRGFTTVRDTFEQAQKLTVVRDAIPNKVVALHYCYQDESMIALITAQKVHFLTRNLRSRLRDHYSTDHNEICFQLETYGIPIDKEILLPNGHLGMKWYNEWITIRQSLEEVATAEQQQQVATTTGVLSSNSNSNSINHIGINITPRKFDVLFGRGRTTREHVGNLRCAHLVEMHQLEYEKCSKSEKTELAKRIVTMIKECNGRFLKKDRKVSNVFVLSAMTVYVGGGDCDCSDFTVLYCVRYSGTFFLVVKK
jgi:hypothetical protein